MVKPRPSEKIHGPCLWGWDGIKYLLSHFLENQPISSCPRVYPSPRPKDQILSHVKIRLTQPCYHDRRTARETF